MIAGFRRSMVCCNGVVLSVHRAGQGEPLLLLHGFPQNHMCWERVALQLARHYDVIIPDLRGYGESEAPPNESGNVTYSKRTMAQDIADLLTALAVQRANILGHDRGARVAYRFALDHPERINKLGIIEIIPTADFWASWTADLAIAAYHWTFLAQPAPLPEQMIGAESDLATRLDIGAMDSEQKLERLSPAALASYRKQIQNPARVHAMCADYRAGASFDRELDEKDKIAGKQIVAPLRLLCGAHGFPAKSGNAVEVWRGWAQRVEASICDAGHFVMEENPEAVLAAFEPFFVP